MAICVSGKTRVYGIFGDPVSHSLSPVMQNAAFRHFGIDAVYVPFHVRAGGLATAVASLRSLDIAGINVTIPHKETILLLLDQLDPVAAQIGAVNTVVNDNGILTGYNTDASGFIRSAQEDLGFAPQGKKVLLLGAGGTCRAVVAVLLSLGVASVIIANRTLHRAQQLVDAFKEISPSQRLLAVGYQDRAFDDALSTADLIVNTTALGLRGEALDFLSLEQLKRSVSLYDMVYSAAGTPLIRSARAAGIRCVDGFALLAAQGDDAFYLWTQQRCPKSFMRQQLLSFQQRSK